MLFQFFVRSHLLLLCFVSFCRYGNYREKEETKQGETNKNQHFVINAQHLVAEEELVRLFGSTTVCDLQRELERSLFGRRLRLSGVTGSFFEVFSMLVVFSLEDLRISLYFSFLDCFTF
jgi:hypothetical protein